MIRKSAITIGTFDGVHKGHRFLVNKTLCAAKKNNLRSVIIVLEEPIKKVKGLLTTYEEKIEEIKFLGADEIFIIEIHSEILSCDPNEFFDKFLCKMLNVSEIVCGSDFAFGKDRKGDIEWLKKKTREKNIRIDIVEPLKDASRQISSSYIRILIEKGDVKNAARLLGRNYFFTGIPFNEKGAGKKLGFPTVNLRVDSDKLLPKGVYISLITQNKRIYPSLTSIGIRSTFDRGNKIVPETHILDFKGTWKKLQTRVMLLKKIRDEKKFVDSKALKAQILKDVSMALRLFKNQKTG
ncbi:riboflavin biosynthesis protein RibF [Candidatus Endomicrobiellum agilis]|uniref:riboflavin biosynthesis protein RibF n=1 Tax=Candidatus Endomicrobiellum agilis TaxID=3238957 RepID=UPI0035790522|nr:riboflavin biosynthesis protein RibF [Endomicrobium sp.]